MGVYDIAYDLNAGKIRTDFFGRNPVYSAKRKILGKETSYDVFEIDRLKSIINDTDKYVITPGSDEIEPFRYVFDEVFEQLGLRKNIVIVSEPIKLAKHTTPIRHKVVTFESEESDIFSLAFKKDSFDKNEVFYWTEMTRALGMYSFHVLYRPEDRVKLLDDIQKKIQESIDRLISTGNQDKKHSLIELYRRDLTHGVKIPNFITMTSSLYGVPYFGMKNTNKPGYKAITFSSNFKLAAAYSSTSYKEFIKIYRKLGYDYNSPDDREKIKDFLCISERNHFRFDTGIHKDISLSYKKFLVMLRFDMCADILLIQSDFTGMTILLNEKADIDKFISESIEVMKLSGAIKYMDSITIHDKPIKISDIYNINSSNHILIEE